MRKTIKLLVILFAVCQSCGQINRNSSQNIEKALKYFNNKEYEKAITYADKLIENNASDYVSWTLKGRALFNLGKKKKGINAINKAIEINPDYSKAYGYRAVMYDLIGNKNANQIINDLNIALSDDPNNLELIKIKAGVYYNTEQFLKAINIYDKLLNLNSNDYETIVLRASTYKKIGNQKLALNGYKQAINLDPKRYFAYKERAAFFIQRQNYDKAISDYSKVIQTIPNKPYLKKIKAFSFNNRGFCYLKKGDYTKSLTNINHSLKLLPSNSYAYKNRALVYLEKDYEEQACSDLRKAIKLGFTAKYGDEVKKLIKENCK